MKIPKIEENKFVVICADAMTGIILNNDGSYYNNVGTNYFKEFDDLKSAKNYALAEINIKNKNLEILIYNHKAEFVELIKKNL